MLIFDIFVDPGAKEYLVKISMLRLPSKLHL
jgi:hypothetical protein